MKRPHSPHIHRNLINEWGGEIVLWIGLVEFMEVHAHTNHTLFFVN
jgi:hypothetical protein